VGGWHIEMQLYIAVTGDGHFTARAVLRVALTSLAPFFFSFLFFSLPFLASVMGEIRF